tara:strand:+ start:4526 stop:5257 length:732 start_codon:yes stop_codon:yes gene_type:complete
MKTVIIIPARMASKRFPGKPMVLIDGIPMIQRVWQQAIKANIGDTYVACCEKEVFELISSQGGNAIITDPELQSGTDRVYAALKKINNYSSFESIINLQGDMPLINPNDIKKVNIPLKNDFEIGTLVTDLTNEEELNQNITKVTVNWIKEKSIGNAFDFYKIYKKNLKKVYHHVGIYSYTFKALAKFISMKPTKNELNYKLEQWRALDANIEIGATFVENIPISIDTKEDLINIETHIKEKND